MPESPFIPPVPGGLPDLGLRALLRLGIARGRLMILPYHRVLERADPLAPEELDAATFDAHMALLVRYCRVLPLGEALSRLRDGSLPRAAVAVTFDDGYRDNFTTALPILKRHGVPATFFIATGYLGRGPVWNDLVLEAVRGMGEGELDLGRLLGERVRVDGIGQRRQLLQRLVARLKYLPPEERRRQAEALAVQVGVRLDRPSMMSSEEVRAMHAAGMGIGAHSVDHPILSTLDDAELTREIRDSRDTLQEIVSAPVDLFAYPNGIPGRDFGEREKAAVRRLGFRAALASSWGVVTRRTDPYALPRCKPWDRTAGRFLLRLVSLYRQTTPVPPRSP
jgi:peptidoglycan/xylan/chitin deacetylase (PgdA/CDA1 family)